MAVLKGRDSFTKVILQIFTSHSLLLVKATKTNHGD